uniref:Putative cask-interacting adaptor protein caskin n=1 Tax=Nyssomyia neivai TaxID=330878 RepID=A0A1L8DLN7_9DIPT
MWDPKSEAAERKASSGKDFDISLGGDSGFMSSEHMSLSEIQSDVGKSSNIPDSTSKQEDSRSSKKITNTSTALDSGIITDSGEASSGEMLLDREVNDNVSEWFCNLNLNSQPINNLSGQKASKRDRVVEVTKSCDVPATQQPWEMYYLQNADGDTHLHLAILDGYVDVAKALIRMNPYPCLLDIQNDFFQSPLHLAVIVGQYATVRHLILAGAEPTIRDYKGNTPLHLACEKGDLACVRALTVPIAMTEIQDVFRSSLTVTSKRRNSPIIQLPGDLDMRNYDGENCVHLAARGRHVDILRHLMWCGADINAKEGKSGETPLHIAVGQEDEHLVNFLVTECPKINLEICTYSGMTAYQFAAINRNQILMKNLARGGAEPLTPPESDYESDSDESQVSD